MAVELYTHTLFSDANLVSYYRMEGNSNDSKGSNNGTDTSITYNVGNGKFGQGAGFGGSSKIAMSAVVIPTGAKTILAWAKSSSTSEQTVCGTLQLGSSPATDQGDYLAIGNGAGDVALYSLQNASALLSVTGTTNVCDGNYHLIGATYNASDSKIRIYVDGALEGTSSGTITDGGTSRENMVIGQDPINFFNKLTGAIDDLAIFNRTLSDAEILAFYNFSISGGGFPIFFGNTAIA